LTDHRDELAEAVRQGRRKEFAHFAAFSDEKQRERIPDPNANSTFLASVPARPADPSPMQKEIFALYQHALRLRAEQIMPRLPGTTAIDAVPLANAGVRATWRMGDGALLTLAANLGGNPVPCAAGEGELLLTTVSCVIGGDRIPAFAACAWLRRP
jgi:maltooligosyltrehalose trehalohydrolase